METTDDKDYLKRANGVTGVVLNQLGSTNGHLAGYRVGDQIREIRPEARVEAGQDTPWSVLELRNVGFSHDGERSHLEGVDLSLRRGRRYALVGDSGSGKSTLLAILAGLEVPETGSLVRDGVELGAPQLRRSATLIPQDAQLFDGTIWDNFLTDEEEADSCRTALLAVGAADLVAREKEGLLGSIAENGANWSGGQRQRFSLARGLVAAADSSLLLLDEPNSGLDSRSGRAEMEALLTACDDRCVVSALHGLHLLEFFDDVVVMQKGKVTELGPLQSMIENSLYLRRALSDRAGRTKVAC